MPEKEYISREAALRANCYFCSAHLEDDSPCVYKCADYMKFMEIPAADVRPVVLCRECKHRDPEDHKCDCGQLERAGCVFPVDDDYYCAHGEKREES